MHQIYSLLVFIRVRTLQHALAVIDWSSFTSTFRGWLPKLRCVRSNRSNYAPNVNTNTHTIIVRLKNNPRYSVERLDHVRNLPGGKWSGLRVSRQQNHTTANKKNIITTLMLSKGQRVDSIGKQTTIDWFLDALATSVRIGMIIGGMFESVRTERSLLQEDVLD